jgi:hypothetical protein
MDSIAPTRKLFAHLAQKPGPRGWQKRAAAETGYSQGYISRLERGLWRSPAAEATLADWKARNL